MVVRAAAVREAVMGAVARVAVKEETSLRPFCSCTAKAILSRGGATHRVRRVSWICSKLAAPMPETVLGRGNHSKRSFVDACAFFAVVRALPPITTRRGPAVALLDLRAVSAKRRWLSPDKTRKFEKETDEKYSVARYELIGIAAMHMGATINAGRRAPAQEVRGTATRAGASGIAMKHR